MDGDNIINPCGNVGVVVEIKMKIHVHQLVYQRVKEIAHAQGNTKSCIVQDALVRLLGMEGMTLEDETIYGKTRCEKKGE